MAWDAFYSDFGGVFCRMEAFEEIDKFHNEVSVFQSAAINFAAVLNLQIFAGAERQGGDIFNGHNKICAFAVQLPFNVEAFDAESEGAAARFAETVPAFVQNAELCPVGERNKFALFYGGENFVEY